MHGSGRLPTFAALMTLMPDDRIAEPDHGVPYEGIENLRPETQKLVEVFKLGQPQELSARAYPIKRRIRGVCSYEE